MKVVVERTIEHPMEDVLDIPAGTTVVLSEQNTTVDEMVEPEVYDEKDNEIDRQFQQVFDAAMNAYQDQMDAGSSGEGKYAARNAEVANGFLNTALSAAKEKANLKGQRQKATTSGGPRTVNNNLIIDRNELLRMLMKDPQT